MPINIGDQFAGTYRILRRLGEGGWGEVYLAKDELLGRKVAIKLLHDRDAEDQTDLVHEMLSLDQLHHPGVVTFYHHFANERTLFLVMEYCEGGSLRDSMQMEPARAETVMQWVKDLSDIVRIARLTNPRWSPTARGSGENAAGERDSRAYSIFVRIIAAVKQGRNLSVWAFLDCLS